MKYKMSLDEYMESELKQRYRNDPENMFIISFDELSKIYKKLLLDYCLNNLSKSYIEQNRILILGAGGIGSNLLLTFYDQAYFLDVLHIKNHLKNIHIHIVDPDIYEYHNIFRVKDIADKRKIPEVNPPYKAKFLSKLLSKYFSTSYTLRKINTIKQLEKLHHKINPSVVIECASKRVENLAVQYFEHVHNIPVISIATDNGKSIYIRRFKEIDNTPTRDGYTGIWQRAFVKNTSVSSLFIFDIIDYVKQTDSEFNIILDTDIFRTYGTSYEQLFDYIKRNFLS